MLAEEVQNNFVEAKCREQPRTDVLRVLFEENEPKRSVCSGFHAVPFR